MYVSLSPYLVSVAPGRDAAQAVHASFSRAVLRIMLRQSFKDTVPRPQTIKDKKFVTYR